MKLGELEVVAALPEEIEMLHKLIQLTLAKVYQQQNYLYKLYLYTNQLSY